PFTVKDFEQGHQDPVFAAAFSPDGKLLASGSAGLERVIKIWNVDDGKVVRDLVNPNIKSADPKHPQSHPGWIYNLRFTTDGNLIGFCDHQRTLTRLAAHSDLTPAQMRAAVYDTPLEDAYEAGEIATAEFLAEVHRRWRLRCDREELAAAWADIFSPNADLCP